MLPKVDCASIFMQEAKKQEGLFKDSMRHDSMLGEVELKLSHQI